VLKINIIRGDKDAADSDVKQISFSEARKSLNGDFMIYDHDLIDIVVSSEKSKIYTFPKNETSEETYDTQRKLLEMLGRFGVVDRDSIKSGSVHSSLEADVHKSADEKISSFQMALLEVYNFIQEEKPNMDSREAYKDKLQNFFLDPDDEETTELGEVPHADKKGSLDHQVRPYGYQYMYSILREMTEK